MIEIAQFFEQRSAASSKRNSPIRAIVGVMPSGVTHFRRLPTTPVIPRRTSKTDEMMIAPQIFDPFFRHGNQERSEERSRVRSRDETRRTRREETKIL